MIGIFRGGVASARTPGADARSHPRDGPRRGGAPSSAGPGAVPRSILPPAVSPLVLIVDDEAPNLESLGKIFEREGWRVALARSGAQALDALRRERASVVVTDLMMPGMSGE